MTHSRFPGRAIASTVALFAVTSFCTALALSSHAPPSPPPATPVDEAVLLSPFQVNATADVTYLAALPPEQLHCAAFAPRSSANGPNKATHSIAASITSSASSVAPPINFLARNTTGSTAPPSPISVPLNTPATPSPTAIRSRHYPARP